MIELIAFDADDTLWHDMPLFRSLISRFKKLLQEYQSEGIIEKTLFDTEIKNLKHFGYGVKGFTLSLIETALDLSEERISAVQIRNILELGKELMNSPVELMAGTRETVETLAKEYRLILITKGDLFHQEAKIARSGLGDYFSHLEIVAAKDQATYEKILAKQGVSSDRFLMVGNSIRSDVLPVLALGAYAVHIPYQIDWAHETIQEEEQNDLLEICRCFQIKSMDLLPKVVQTITSK